MMEILYYLKNSKVLLWHENENLKAAIPKGSESEKYREIIKKNKEQILKLLIINEITSRDNFIKKTIFKCNADSAPLSFAQKRLWFIDCYEGGTNAYNIPSVMELKKGIDLNLLKEAIQIIIGRHEILRTVYRQGKDGKSYQKILTGKLKIEEKQLSYPEFESELKRDVNIIFDLKNEYPIKTFIYNITNDRLILLINIHHIAFDGWSADIFFRELHDLYEGMELPELPVQYSDFAVWQKEYLKGKILEEQLHYWKESLSGYETLDFPIDNTRPSVIDYTGDDFFFSLDSELSEMLRRTSKNLGVSLYTFLLAGFNILLSRYTGQEDIILGTPVANRHFNGIENTIGFFINSLALRNNIKPNLPLKEFIYNIHQNLTGAQKNQDLPFEKLVRLLNVEKDQSKHPIFQIMFSVQRFGEKDNSSIFKPFHFDCYKIAKNDLTLLIDDTSDEMHCCLNFGKVLFNIDTIERISLHYKNILQQMVKNLDSNIQDINLLSSEEYQTIIYDWNNTSASYPKNKTIHQLFEEIVEKDPDNPAVVFKDKTLNYRELNEKANQLAHCLRDRYKKHCGNEIKGDTLIGIYIDRSIEMIIAMLGILKAGAAYVPFDRADPEERLRFKINDSECSMVLTSSANLKALLFLAETDTVPLALDAFWDEIEKFPCTNPKPVNNSSNLAYVIFTSGSTGKPKGVMIEHKTVINLIYAKSNLIEISSKTRALQFASPAFDASVWEIFPVLTLGGSLYIIDDLMKTDKEVLNEYIKNNKISLATLSPAFLVSMDEKKLIDFNSLIVAGDICDLQIMEKWSKNRKLINAYGPTESTVCATMHYFNINDTNTNIGKAINNIEIYLLDASLQPVPIGVKGEIYIGGEGLARGYLNRPELTAERFIDNPFTTDEMSKKHSSKIYKTGDLARWLPDGDLEFIGRNDNQVKIRGFRVELGEIESKLSDHSMLKQAAVDVYEKSGEKYLTAYYVLRDSSIPGVESIEEGYFKDNLKKYLSGKLPDYMVPSFFVKLDEFLLNTSGKIDRKVLPEPVFKKDSTKYLPPQNELEEKILSVWKEILEVDDISVNDNFFDIGGHSIKLIQLKSRLEHELSLPDIAASDLFKYSTIRGFTVFLTGKDKNSADKYNLNVQGTTAEEETDIAVIAYSGAFSGAQSIEEYWSNIASGKECIEFLSEEECKVLGIKDELFQNSLFIPAGGRIKDTDKFDNLFWGLSPKEASLMDPQIRKFIEHCWVILEQSGYLNEREKLNIGVFAGSGNSGYLSELIQPNHNINPEAINIWEADTMNGNGYISTRTSYLLNLRGPALNIYTACSTSLTTIVEACKNLSNYSCNMAIAGGVTLSLPDLHGYLYQEGMIMSKDGHCRTFDINSSGTTPGVGVGAVLLKRMKDAEKDGDNILSVVKGYALNNDGKRKVGFTAPSIIGQTECIINAQRKAKITADTIDYVECHGTATKLGDPIEITALHDSFKANAAKDKKCSCILGAVKANIGHTDTAAGIAGFIKVCKMLEEKIIPPQINFSKANPEIKLDKTPFKIITEKKIWQKKDHPRRAGVSSFGIGGTNAHVILEEYENTKDKNKTRSLIKQPQIITISAKSRSSLEAYKEKLIQFFEANPKVDLGDIAYSLQTKKEEFVYRSSVVCNTLDEAPEKLRKSGLPVQLTKHQLSNSPNIIFMFSGQGSQYPNMCRSLYENESCFKENVDRCCSIISEIINEDFSSILFSEGYIQKTIDFSKNQVLKTNSKQAVKQIKIDTLGYTKDAEEVLKQTKYTQPALFTISYSLAKLFEAYGIKADAYIGHSIGEYAAAALAGVFTLEDAVKIVLKRAEFMQQMSEGCMLSINISEEKLNKLLPDNVELSVINTNELCVVSGNDTNVKSFKELLDSKGVNSTILHTSHAFHSYMMDDMIQPFEAFVNSINMHAPNVPFISNVTGKFISEEQAVLPSYWASQVRKAVQFSKGLITLDDKYLNAVYVELGPGNVLSSFARQHRSKQKDKTGNNPPFRAISSVLSVNEYKGKQNLSDNSFYKALGQLWCCGFQLNWELIHKNKFEDLKFISALPYYQFDKTKCWLDRPEQKKNIDNKLILQSESEWLYQTVWKKLSKITNINYINLPKKEKWLIFADDTGCSEKIDKLLKGNKQEVISIYADASISNCVIENNKILMNPFAEYSYEKLAKHLKSIDFSPTIILHLWTVSNNNSKQQLKESIKKQQYYGFYSLFFFQQYILPKVNDNIKLLVLTNGITQITGNDTIYSGKGTILGALRVIPHEMPWVKSACLDIGFERNISPEYLVTFALNDKHYDFEPTYSLRMNSLWGENIEKILIEPLQDKVINDGDVILITGGLGGIALTIVNEIAKYHNVTFILTGRTHLPDEILKDKLSEYQKLQISNIKSLKKSNCTVEIIYADISSKDDVNNLVSKINKKFGSINTVIHTAGVVPLSLKNKTVNEIENALSAKVFGAVNIIEALQNERHIYFIMTSSLASLMGDIGRIEYCAANSFLDVLAASPSTKNIGQFLSINWPGWSDVGMGIRYKGEDDKEFIPEDAITHKQGAKLFYNLINQKEYHHIAVSKYDIQNLKKSLFQIDNAEDKTIENIDIKKQNILVETKASDLEYKLAIIFHEVLGVDRISKNDDFFELGGTSLNALHVINKINNTFNIKLTPSFVMDNSTIYEISQQLEYKNKSTDFIVKLKGGEGIPVFLIHPIGGDVLCYREFCENFMGKNPIYGIRDSEYSSSNDETIHSINDMAKLYIRELRKIHESGPYMIGGSSFGGIVAYEMSNILINDNEDVLTFMIDTPGPKRLPEKLNSYSELFEYFFSYEDGKSELKTIENLRMFDNDETKFIDYVILNKIAGFDDKELLKKMLNIFFNNQKIMNEYQNPDKFKGKKILFFKAMEVNIHMPEKIEKGWKDFVSRDQFELYEIPGNHLTMTSSPNVEKICKILDDCWVL